MNHTPHISSAYLGKALNPVTMRTFVRKAVPVLKKYDFEAFAFRGISGALIAPVLAYKMGKSLIAVRKPKDEESHHSWMKVEGDMNVKRYIIADDFISTGMTVKSIVRAVRDFAENARCIGAIEFNQFGEEGSRCKLTNLSGYMTPLLLPFLVDQNNEDDYLETPLEIPNVEKES